MDKVTDGLKHDGDKLRLDLLSPEIIEAVDYVVNYKQLDKGRPKASSIIKLTANGTVTVIRE